MKPKKVPMRRCVGCMQSKEKPELIRIAAHTGKAVIDPAGKMDGRGVYLCKNTDCFNKAVKKKSIGRGLRIEGLSPENIESLKMEFVRRFE